MRLTPASSRSCQWLPRNAQHLVRRSRFIALFKAIELPEHRALVEEPSWRLVRALLMWEGFQCGDASPKRTNLFHKI